jgi:hypothetical protein
VLFRSLECLWLSHLAQVVGGIGCVIGSPLWITSALCSVFVLHGLWVVDALAGACFGVRPLGATAFLDRASVADWFVLHSHFYVWIALAAAVLAVRKVHPRGWLGASALMLAALLTSLVVSTPARNINMAWRPGPGLTGSFLAATRSLGLGPWVASLWLGASLCFFLPTQLAASVAFAWLDGRTRRTRRDAGRSTPAHER